MTDPLSGARDPVSAVREFHGPDLRCALATAPVSGGFSRLALTLAVVVGLASCAPASAPEAAPAPAATPAPGAAPTTDASAVAAAAEEWITAEAISGHIDFLASDEMRGRDTPSPELARAADYLAERFGAMGLEPGGDEGTFLQWWPFERFELDPEESVAAVTAGGESRTWRYGEDYFAVPAPPTRVEGTPVYAPTPAAAMSGLPEATAGAPLVVGLPDGLGPDFGTAIQAGMQAGAAGVVVILDEETGASDIYQIGAALEGGAAGQLPIPVLGVRLDVGDELLVSAGVEPRGGRDPPTGDEGIRVLEGVTLTFQTSFGQVSDDVANVVAVVPGSDPELAGEYVVITAHYDHVGVGPPDERGDSIFSGADDNASGTAALLQAAAAFAALPEAPARSVLFLAVSGEEKGLLGSAHYARNPTVPGDGIVANINLDMVSRNHPDTVYAIGDQYTTLGALVVEIARDHPELGLVPAPDPEPEEQAFLRSDHYSFVEQGVPALMLTTWLHDDYHVPSDLPERVDPDKAARVARLAFLLAHRVAMDPERPRWTAEGEALLRQLEQQGMPPG